MAKFLWSNNSRKMAGKPLWRKKNKKKRYYTRNRNEEAVDALLEYWNS